MSECTLPDEVQELVWIYIRDNLRRRAKCLSESWRALHVELMRYVCGSKLSQIDTKWKRDIWLKQDELDLGVVDDYEYKRWFDLSTYAYLDARRTVFNEWEEAWRLGKRMGMIAFNM